MDIILGIGYWMPYMDIADIMSDRKLSLIDWKGFINMCPELRSL
jgi:hypothetical protein